MKIMNKLDQINRYTKKIITTNGIHIGQPTYLTNKKINRYILGSRNSIEIFDLETIKYFITRISLLLSVLCQTVEKPSLKILFATTSTPYSKIVKDAAMSCGMQYIVKRWSTGWLTSLKNYKKKEIILKPEFIGYWKNNHKAFFKEFNKTIDLNKLKKNTQLLRQPVLLIIPDIDNNLMILHEADQMNIPVISLINTSSNKLVDYPLLGNDRSLVVNFFFCNLLATLINNNNYIQDYRSIIKTKNFNKVLYTTKKNNKLKFEKAKAQVKKFFWQFLHNYIFLRKTGKKDIRRVFRFLFFDDYTYKRDKYFSKSSLAFFSNLLLKNINTCRLNNNKLLLNINNSTLRYKNIYKIARSGRLYKFRKAFKIIKKKWNDWKYYGKHIYLKEKWNPRFLRWSSFINYTLKQKPLILRNIEHSWWLKPWKPWLTKKWTRNKNKYKKKFSNFKIKKIVSTNKKQKNYKINEKINKTKRQRTK